MVFDLDMLHDMDFLHDLDIDQDGVVDASDLQFHELNTGHDMSLYDLDHNGLADHSQADFNADSIPDYLQADLNNNTILDQFEFHEMGTTLNYDINHDGNVDDMDLAIAQILFKK